MADALTTRKPVKWVSIVTTKIKDPAVDASKLKPGQAHREIVVADLIDELGRWWRKFDDGDLEYVGLAPAEPPPTGVNENRG